MREWAYWLIGGLAGPVGAGDLPTACYRDLGEIRVLGTCVPDPDGFVTLLDPEIATPADYTNNRYFEPPYEVVITHPEYSAAALTLRQADAVRLLAPESVARQLDVPVDGGLGRGLRWDSEREWLCFPDGVCRVSQAKIREMFDAGLASRGVNQRRPGPLEELACEALREIGGRNCY